MSALSPYERSLILARLARAKSKLRWRAKQEAVAIDKLMALDAVEAKRLSEPPGDLPHPETHARANP